MSSAAAAVDSNPYLLGGFYGRTKSILFFMLDAVPFLRPRVHRVWKRSVSILLV